MRALSFMIAISAAVSVFAATEVYAEETLSCSSQVTRDTIEKIVVGNYPLMLVPGAHFQRNFTLNAIRTQETSPRRVTCEARLKVEVVQNGDNSKVDQNVLAGQFIINLRHLRDEEIFYKVELTDDNQVYVTIKSAAAAGDGE